MRLCFSSQRLPEEPVLSAVGGPLATVAALLLFSGCARASVSVYTLRPEDPSAVYATREDFGLGADGVADDTAALQKAIDRVQETTRRGVVFVPEGRYRLTKPLLVWSGIRLIGYGASRPVFVLGRNTPGYQEGAGRYLVHFVSDRPERADQPVRDANPGTFYSAMSNIDIEIGDGNPAAVGVRSHWAQHCFLRHMEFRIGEGRAGIEEVGNESSDLRFVGGDYGIYTHKPSPSWPFVLLDSSFEGQRKAAIETEEGGLTLIRLSARDVPCVVRVREGRDEELFIRDSRFERIGGAIIEADAHRNARMQLTVLDSVCSEAPVLTSFRGSKEDDVRGPARLYRVREYVRGLHIDGAGRSELGTTALLEPLSEPPPPVESDIHPLPPMQDWTSVRSFGAKGDGETDDTAALRAAIAARKVLYFPAGRYRVTGTLTLASDTVLVGFSPITTQLIVKDRTPAFQGEHAPEPEERSAGRERGWGRRAPFPGKGTPVPLIDTLPGGTNLVSGLGLDTGGANNRAVGLRWRAGERSLVDDVRFLGGHGTYGVDGQWLPLYNDNRTADPDPRRSWDSQYPSLWVTDGGGGTFKGLWTPSPFASAGLLVSDTETPGRVYALSSEHHVRHEVRLRNVSNWSLYALQTEAERGESPQALPLEIDRCRNLLVANFFIYRVEIPTPYPAGIRVTRSRDLVFRGLHVYSPGKLSYDNTLVDEFLGLEIRAREVARLSLADEARRTTPTDERVRRLAGGFCAADGMASDGAGGVVFVDQARSMIHRWTPRDGLSSVTDAVPQPVALAVARNGEILALSRHGLVYSILPGKGEPDVSVLPPTAAEPAGNATYWLPANRWRDAHDWLEANLSRATLRYLSSDGTATILAPESYGRLAQSRGAWALGTIDVARTFQLVPVRVGGSLYVGDEFGQTTWKFRVGNGGLLEAPEPFAGEGEAGVVSGTDGRVYVCAGELFVYDKDGKQLDAIRLPERPSSLAFGGEDGRTLLVTARTGLYAVRP